MPCVTTKKARPQGGMGTGLDGPFVNIGNLRSMTGLGLLARLSDIGV